MGESNNDVYDTERLYKLLLETQLIYWKPTLSRDAYTVHLEKCWILFSFDAINGIRGQMKLNKISILSDVNTIFKAKEIYWDCFPPCDHT